jgi:short-subunit dehydrogenase
MSQATNSSRENADLLPLAVITGASAGIGEALARCFAANGYNLVLIARRIDRLQALGHELQEAHAVHCDSIEADLGDIASVDHIEEVLAGRRVNVLINNAGVMLSGQFCQADPAALSTMLSVNVMTMVLLTRRLIPRMIDSGEGRVLIVSSMAAFFPCRRIQFTPPPRLSALPCRRRE